MLTISDHGLSSIANSHGWSAAFFVLPGRSSICGWPGPASLLLEDVVDLLKRLFALSVAQDISSLEKHGSILLELNRDGGELPSTLQFCHEVAHVGKQGFENFCLLILLYCLEHLCLQLRPGWRLTRPGSRLGGRRAWTAAHVVFVLRLVHRHVVISRFIGLLKLNNVNRPLVVI